MMPPCQCRLTPLTIPCTCQLKCQLSICHSNAGAGILYHFNFVAGLNLGNRRPCSIVIKIERERVRERMVRSETDGFHRAGICDFSCIKDVGIMLSRVKQA